MGMFDTVTFEDLRILPIPEEISGLEIPNDFQSKDFDCLMDEYYISKDRKIFKRKYKWVKCTDAEYDDYLKTIEEFKSSSLYDFWKENGKNKRVFDFDEEIPDLHGYYRVYDYIKRKPVEWYIEYRLKFTDGILVDISVSELESHERS